MSEHQNLLILIETNHLSVSFKNFRKKYLALISWENATLTVHSAMMYEIPKIVIFH
ncbi:hypothetical protein KKB18_10215 [bacterium]|nr:hypothetical protein [bacterium]